MLKKVLLTSISHSIIILSGNSMQQYPLPNDFFVHKSLVGNSTTIAVSSMIDAVVLQKFSDIGIPFFVMPKVTFRRYTESMLNKPHITKDSCVASCKEIYLKQKIADYVQYIGIPVHLKGYQYICAATFFLMTYPEDNPSVTKILYPEVAKKHKTTAVRVERAIRSAIEVAWDKYEDTIKNIIGCPFINYRPTNSEFLALVKRCCSREIYIPEEKTSAQELLVG